MLKLNRNTYLDKLHACWLGKNIGGTMGAPYEGKIDFLDVHGFITKKNEPIPNDDLDLQLVWLVAMEMVGPANFDANVLADFWTSWIPPIWNEYGICKTNLALGLMPPMSGEVDNDKWKTSNGAWIRSELWASLAPGVPDVAVKYATMDAMVDHGISEGVCAEIFTACLQSLAYVESDVRVLINTALKKIPEDSMIAKTARLVMECYDQKIPYRETRERVIALNKELGWFQAPANIGFVIIGLLYGEGDFKKSLICAINCGDDTDCTAATVGAILGIIGGTAGIPEELKEHIGDRIVTVSINGTHAYWVPKTCEQLTERVYALVPAVMEANNVAFSFTEDATDYPEEEKQNCNKITSKELLDRSPYSYDVTNYRPFSVRVEMDQTPRVCAGDERKITLTFFNKVKYAELHKLQLRLILPEGWTAGKYDRTVQLLYAQPVQKMYGDAKTEFSITVGEKVDIVNRAYVEIVSPILSYPVMVPLTFIG